jgi:hypothetical protein
MCVVGMRTYITMHKHEIKAPKNATSLQAPKQLSAYEGIAADEEREGEQDALG